jgi:hypothetical protein
VISTPKPGKIDHFGDFYGASCRVGRYEITLSVAVIPRNIGTCAMPKIALYQHSSDQPRQ